MGALPGLYPFPSQATIHLGSTHPTFPAMSVSVVLAIISPLAAGNATTKFRLLRSTSRCRPVTIQVANVGELLLTTVTHMFLMDAALGVWLPDAGDLPLAGTSWHTATSFPNSMVRRWTKLADGRI